MFCGACQRYFTIKDIHTFAKEYMLSWFPKLPSYQTFCKRLNMLQGAIVELTNQLFSSFKPYDCYELESLLDSMPIVTCAGRNKKGKVAQELTDKGFCSTKNMYYYGSKLHVLASRRVGSIPFPEIILISPASENDLTVFKYGCGDYIYNKDIYADKIYSDLSYFEEKQQTQSLRMYTPIKTKPKETELSRQRNKAYNDVFSRAVSQVRQPIESFFNWLNEKTNIQRAVKVRSTSGLMVHIMGKIAIAFIYLIF